MKHNVKIILLITILIFVIWGIISLLSHPSRNNNANPERQTATTSQAHPQILHWNHPPQMVIDQEKTYKAVLETTKGNMAIKLFVKDAPITVNNFIFLARQGFYNNTKFHRIIKDFMIQGGDPTGTGRGGPGYTFKDELPITKDYKRGIVAMANAGPNTNGSQFFIMTKDTPLPKRYVIFGELIDGFDTLDKIANTPVENNGMGEISKPIENVYIKTIDIQEK